jgi:hypothetical protein
VPAGDAQPWPGDCAVPTADEENYRLVLGNENTGGRSWLGGLYLFAVYDRALTTSEVTQNYDAGP